MVYSQKSAIQTTMQLETIADVLESVFHGNLSVYIYESDGYVRLTNGSVGWFIDIQPKKDQIILDGQRYDIDVHERCDQSKESLKDALSRCV